MNRIIKGMSNPKKAYSYLKRRLIEEFEAKLPIGANIYNYEWDVLIVLDACRCDLFREFCTRHDAYEHIHTLSEIYSVASATRVWFPRTFNQAPVDAVKNTHYVTAQTPPGDYGLYQVDSVWEYANDPDSGVTRPEAVTDAAIDAIRHSDAERVGVHYAQPHAPFLHCVGKYDSRSIPSVAGASQNVWAGLSEGRFDKEEIWEDYGRNLLRGLDEVEKIIRNAEGKIVITSDHGNALGEWGFYGHPSHVPINSIRKVPWAEAQGLDKHSYDVKGKEAMSTDIDNASIDEHLRALGYKT